MYSVLFYLQALSILFLFIIPFQSIFSFSLSNLKILIVCLAIVRIELSKYILSKGRLQKIGVLTYCTNVYIQKQTKTSLAIHQKVKSFTNSKKYKSITFSSTHDSTLPYRDYQSATSHTQSETDP